MSPKSLKKLTSALKKAIVRPIKGLCRQLKSLGSACRRPFHRSISDSDSDFGWSCYRLSAEFDPDHRRRIDELIEERNRLGIVFCPEMFGFLSGQDSNFVNEFFELAWIFYAEEQEAPFLSSVCPPLTPNKFNMVAKVQQLPCKSLCNTNGTAAAPSQEATPSLSAVVEEEPLNETINPFNFACLDCEEEETSFISAIYPPLVPNSINIVAKVWRSHCDSQTRAVPSQNASASVSTVSEYEAIEGQMNQMIRPLKLYRHLSEEQMLKSIESPSAHPVYIWRSAENPIHLPSSCIQCYKVVRRTTISMRGVQIQTAGLL